MALKRRGRHPRNDLDSKKVAALVRKKEVGRHFDGDGLHLWVKPSGTASWVLRVTAAGRRRDVGLGGANTVSLADARELARKYRAIAKAGGDPIGEKRRSSMSIPTFEEMARKVHAARTPSWRNSKHSDQWLTTLKNHAFAEIGKLRVNVVDVPDVLRVLSPIWRSKPETARRIRQRVRIVLDHARAEGYRSGENPVGPVLAKALPTQTGGRGHHAAMPYSEVPAFMAALREPEGGEISRLALEFLILTAVRTGEVLGARRSEVDLDKRAWTIPADRMKAGRAHRVPLSEPAMAVLRRALELSTDEEFLFPGPRRGRPLSNMALLMLMRRMGVQATVHGFRSSFSDWCAEETNFPAEVREMALAHSIGNKTEAAYRRGDLFEKRRKLMAAWGSFVMRTPAAIVPFQKKTA